MASPLYISIPPLTEGQGIEEWKPIFIAATSALVVNASQKVAIQMLPSFVGRNQYEQSVILQAIQEETLEEHLGYCVLVSINRRIRSGHVVPENAIGKGSSGRSFLGSITGASNTGRTY